MMQNLFSPKKTLFIPFIMAGFPSLEESYAQLVTLAELGADIIEFGVPFSDPIADGPINQFAAQQALLQGTHLNLIFQLVSRFRAEGFTTPIILFTYLNPLLAFGFESCAIAAKNAGINGLLIVDLPPEENPQLYLQLKSAGLEIILLASPTTEIHRLQFIRELEPAFIYCISRLGVTGKQQPITLQLRSQLKLLREHLNLPIAVGFGISTPEQANEIAKIADGVVVGSALIEAMMQNRETFYDIASAFLQSLR